MLLARRIKDAATSAFRDNARLAVMSPEDRETAARFYETISAQTVGAQAELARLYNLECARFLCGEVNHIAATAREFASEMGL